MTEDHYYDPVEREELREEDEILADLLAQYMLRREAGVVIVYPDLLARAQEHGDRVAANFETLVVYWELKRQEGEADARARAPTPGRHPRRPAVRL